MCFAAAPAAASLFAGGAGAASAASFAAGTTAMSSAALLAAPSVTGASIFGGLAASGAAAGGGLGSVFGMLNNPYLRLAGQAGQGILGYVQNNQQAKYASAVARNNAIVAERAAKDALARGDREEHLRRLQTSQDVSSAKTLAASGGFNVNSGSALTRQSDLDALGDVEALTIRNNSQREAYGIRTSAAASAAQSQGQIAGFQNAGLSSLITGARKTQGLYSSFKKSGVIR